jgi:Trk K+ transport system NAD-binding subunit
MDEPATPRVRAGHVVLCGLNELGYRTLEELSRMGAEVVVVVRAADADLATGARALGATLVQGSYRDESVLRAAGVPAAAALVVTEDDDVGNLHAALTAHDLNPTLRIRLRMFNQELGRRVERLFRDCQVLDAAALVAPAFVAAAVHRDAQQAIEVGGRRLVVRHGSAVEPEVLLPLASVDGDGTGDLFPSDGDDLLCLAAEPVADGLRAHGPARRRNHPGRLATAWAVLAGADVRLRAMAAVVLALMLVSVAVFARFAHLDLVDAIYFSVTIITTTGFGDINLRDAPAALQLYGVVLMLSGTAALAILFALIADMLVSARLARILGGSVPRAIRDHVVVCGLGNIGYRIVEQLVEMGVPVVAAEQQEANRFLPVVRRLGVPVLTADVRLTETLRTLRVLEARSVVVVTSSDIVNLETALNVRALAPDRRVVLRLFDPDLAARVERAFGIDISRSPSALAAPAFAAAAEGEHVLATIAVGVRALAVVRLRVAPGSRAAGRPVGELERTTRSRVLLLEDGGPPSWRPPGGATVAAGGELVVVVPRGELGTVLAWTEAGVGADRDATA